VLGHLWSNSLMAGYPSAFNESGRCDRSQMKSRLFLHLYRCEARAQWRNRFLISTLTETDTAADIRCIIRVSRIGFSTTNNPESSRRTNRLVPSPQRIHTREWTSRQERFYRRRRKDPYSTGEQWTTALIEFFWTHGKIL
jgi:hypothetical protein